MNKNQKNFKPFEDSRIELFKAEMRWSIERLKSEKDEIWNNVVDLQENALKLFITLFKFQSPKKKPKDGRYIQIKCRNKGQIYVELGVYQSLTNSWYIYEEDGLKNLSEYKGLSIISWRYAFLSDEGRIKK